MVEPVRFKSGGARLVGVLARPDGPAVGGVVLVHGWTGYRMGPHRMLVNAARRLNEAGFATLHFDLRGRGDSEGDYDRTDLDMMIEDALAACRHLWFNAGFGDLSLLGLCSGANVALGAATLDHTVRSVVAWSALPFQKQVTQEVRSARRRGNLAQYVRKLFRPETWKKVLTGRVRYDLVGKALSGRDAAPPEQPNLKDSSRDILADLGRYPGRILFVHGSKDPEGMVGRDHFMAFCRKKGVNARFHLIEGANHSFYSLAWEEEVIAESLRFLRESS
jgi:dienelactone hydrolase